MSRAWCGCVAVGLVWVLAMVVSGCAGAPPVASAPASVDAVEEVASPSGEAERGVGDEGRRVFAPVVDGEPVLAGISYGPYREGQRPGGVEPSEAQVREDLHIIARHWKMLRVYGSRGSSETILRVIKEDGLGLVVVLGAWIAPNDPQSNEAEVAEAIRLARRYPEQVAAVSVGNETQVFWSGHRTEVEVLIGHLREVRAAVSQPVTTADDYNFWNKPESHAVAAEVDFVLLHAYAMWNQQPLKGAVAWTAETVAAIKAEHPQMLVVLGETGWATELNPQGDEVKYIKAPAGEAEQATFYAEFTAWAHEASQPYFYFEAFDEPWKGGDDPREVEKHWGLYREDRTAKPAIKAP